MRFSFNEIIQSGNILQFGISIEEKRCMIGIGKATRVQFLKICCKIVYTLGI